MIPKRWESKIDMTGPDGCWLWTGTLNEDGYAKVSSPEGRTAHRVMYLRTYGSIPDGLELDHLCRVRHCVNPAHLEAVTHVENVWRSSHVRLTPADVVAIRLSSETTEVLAERYGVSYVTAYQARVGVSWKAIETEAVPFPRGQGVRVRSHCLRGHELTAENTLVASNGGQKCLDCQAIRPRRLPAKTCPQCGSLISERNFPRHLRLHEAAA